MKLLGAGSRLGQAAAAAPCVATSEGPGAALLLPTCV